MKSTYWRLGASALALVFVTTAFAQPAVDYEFSQYPSDFPIMPDVARSIEFDDLIVGYDLGAGAFFETGWIDPNNGVGSHIFNANGCLKIFDGIEDPFEFPVFSFWRDDPASNGDPNYWMFELTNGDGVFAVPLCDFARASNVVRYDFDEPTDIGEIVVWSEFEDDTVGSGRIFQNYDVFVSYDDSTENMTLLAQDVRNGEWLASVADPLDLSSYTLLYNCGSDTLATGVTKIRFVFYPTTYHNSDLFGDAWRGYWHPMNSPEWNSCEATYPADPRDRDGAQMTFVASWISEIDVLAPQGTLNGPGDGNGDSLVNMSDFDLFAAAMAGPENGPAGYDNRPFDLAANDCVIDLGDFAQMQALVVP